MVNFEEDGRIVISRDGVDLAYIRYATNSEEEITILKTFVEPIGRGQGLAKDLNEKMLDYIYENHIKKVNILCSYSQNYYLKNKDKYNGVEVVLIEGENNVCSI